MTKEVIKMEEYEVPGWVKNMKHNSNDSLEKGPLNDTYSLKVDLPCEVSQRDHPSGGVKYSALLKIGASLFLSDSRESEEAVKDELRNNIGTWYSRMKRHGKDSAYFENWTFSEFVSFEECLDQIIEEI